MTVQEVITYLRSGEFKNLSTSAFDNDSIISYINLGVIELYKRFNLKTKEYLLDLEDNITIYNTPSDCMSILEIYDEEGEMYPLNDEDNINSILTPSWDEIQVPNPYTGMTISIIYLANPTTVINLTDTVPLPAFMLEPLLHYCGYRGHMARDGGANAENNVHYIRFESSCKRVKESGLVTPDDVHYKQTTQQKGYV